MGIFVFWIIGVFVVGFIGADRKIGFWGAFFLSLFLSPIIGLLVTLFSTSNTQIEYQKKMLDLQKKQVAGGSTADELRKLAELRREGLLSEEEYESQRQRILGH